MINYSSPDLTQHPPRSPRVRLGGYAHLPRLIDKTRAVIAGKGGDYHYNCPVDQKFFAFTGIAAEVFYAEVQTGKSDAELLAWVATNSRRQPFEVAAWSQWFEQAGAGGADGHEWVANVIKGNHSERDDIRSFADVLDFDDYVTFGGKS
jgi:Domain of unknown function (DUF5069)